MSELLSTHLSSLNVVNVFVYVADALRWDALPDWIERNGLTAKGVAASIHTPTAFASLVSGVYPPATGVFEFSNQIGAPTVFDVASVDSSYDSSMLESPGPEDSLFSVFDLDPDTYHATLINVSPPFVHVERANGGHAPYGESNLTAWEYFREHGHKSSDWLRAEYKRRIKQDTARFRRRLKTLKQRGLKEDTLVIYTADHGELLGEGGLLGHNSPMRPELVYVPFAFIHPDLPDGAASQTLVRHVDLLPTICNVLGKTDPWPVELDGRTLTGGAGPSYGLSFYDSSFFTDRVPGLSGHLAYAGAWDSSGGHVFAESPLRDRCSVFAGKMLRSAKRSHLRRHPLRAFGSYVRGDHTYGSPDIDRETARETVDDAYARSIDRTSIELSAATEDRLKSLGYL